MKRIAPFILILFWVYSCREDTVTSYMTPERAIYYFSSIEEICRADAGNLWGENLAGPIMYVDRVSRKIIANAPDKENLLKLKDGVYTGIYPKEKLIDVIAVEFGGTLFAMVRIPDEEDDYRIKALTIHSLVHCMQEKLEIDPERFNNRHMNEKNARMWLKLEWRALKNALSTEGEERYLAVRDALIFRGARHEAYPDYIYEETRFENYEGLPTFSYTLLCTASKEEQTKRLIDGIDYYYNLNFGYNYGFIHGALYAYLLYDKGFRLNSVTSDSTDLGVLTAELYNITMPDILRDVAGSIAINYDIESIQQEEIERQKRIKEASNKRLSAYTEKPVVFFDLESPSFGFEPDALNSLDTLGTIYSSLRVSDNWGKLIVEETGCLVSYNLKEIRVPAKGIKISKSHIRGEGWELILTDTWELVKTDENYRVKRLSP